MDTLTWPVRSGTATRLHAHVPTEPWRFRPAGSGTPSGPRSVCTFNPETVSTEAWRRTKCQVCAERRCPLSWRATSWSVSEHGEPRRGRAFRAAAGAGLGAGRAALLRFQLSSCPAASSRGPLSAPSRAGSGSSAAGLGCGARPGVSFLGVTHPVRSLLPASAGKPGLYRRPQDPAISRELGSSERGSRAQSRCGIL